MLSRLDFVRCVGYLRNGLRDNKPQNVEGNYRVWVTPWSIRDTSKLVPENPFALFNVESEIWLIFYLPVLTRISQHRGAGSLSALSSHELSSFPRQNSDPGAQIVCESIYNSRYQIFISKPLPAFFYKTLNFFVLFNFRRFLLCIKEIFLWGIILLL